LACLFSIFTLIALSGCATSTQAPPLNAQSPLQVPSIKVVVDCGSCQVRPNVPTLILDGYRGAASKAGAQISPTSEAIVTIQEYSDRNDTARFLVGAFAGKDEIRAEVIYQEKKFIVEDYYRNAWLGIESLANKIGEMVFAEVK